MTTKSQPCPSTRALDCGVFFQKLALLYRQGCDFVVIQRERPVAGLGRTNETNAEHRAARGEEEKCRQDRSLRRLGRNQIVGPGDERQDEWPKDLAQAIFAFGKTGTA